MREMPSSQAHFASQSQVMSSQVPADAFSRYSEERWRSEGIQIGGPRSGRGVLGNWFDKDFDRHGPAGPTAFWKVSDHIEDGKDGEGEQSEGSLGDEESEGDTEYMSD